MLLAALRKGRSHLGRKDCLCKPIPAPHSLNILSGQEFGDKQRTAAAKQVVPRGDQCVSHPKTEILRFGIWVKKYISRISVYTKAFNIISSEGARGGGVGGGVREGRERQQPEDRDIFTESSEERESRDSVSAEAVLERLDEIGLPVRAVGGEERYPRRPAPQIIVETDLEEQFVPHERGNLRGQRPVSASFPEAGGRPYSESEALTPSTCRRHLRRQAALPDTSRLGSLNSFGGAMSVFRQDSLSEESNRESSASFTAVAGVALQFTASASSTSTSSTQTSTETVIHRMVGTGVQTSGNGVGSVPAASTEATPILHAALTPAHDWCAGGVLQPDESMSVYEGEMRRKDHIIEELIKLHPNHGLNKARGGGDVEEALRSDLAAMTVKVDRTEQQIRDALASVASKDSRVAELTRQLDAHRQEHARQAATIVTLRQKLQEEESAGVSLRANQRRGEYTLGALSRENRQYADRINELENRLR
ncbi:hypothetical protein SK128_022134 [Halocaridina rubra]|uniref:Uncharacterized protein n=1 Tax=Halocaridina rubra TaxID=373956 RepID=A0AAN8XDR9_HALRR